MKMKNKLSIILFLTVIALFSSCKKEYTCTCSDSVGNKTIAFTEKNTKGKASDKCNDYYNQNYASIPWDDTTCSIE